MSHPMQRGGRISRGMSTATVRIVLLTVIAPLCAVTLGAQTQPSSGWTFHLLYQFKNGAGGAYPYATPILDSEGNLYGTTCNDGAFASGTVWKLSPDGKHTALYSFKQTGGGGAFPYSSLVLDAGGNLYATTQFGGVYGGSCGATGCGTVFKIDPAGNENVLHQFMGGTNDGSQSEQGLVLDPGGNLYGTTWYGGTNGLGVIFRIDSSGNETVVHNFDPSTDGYWPYGGTLLRDSAGNFYGTAEYGGAFFFGTVFRMDSSGTVKALHSFGGPGDGANPIGSLVRDAAGNLYGVTNRGGAFNFGTVFKIDSSGNETVLYSFSGTGGDGAAPIGGLTRDSAGNLYGTTDSGGSHYLGTVFTLDPTNKETILHNFDGATGKNPEFTLLLDSKGNLYGTAFEGGAYGGGVVYELTH
jgi:uncharacterized repeat protein (TIGR03803 family)